MSDAVPPGPEPPRLNRGELQDRAVRGAAWTVVHTLVSVPVAFIVNLLVARVLGVSDYGRLAYLTAVMMVATGVLTLGLRSALVQFGAKAHAAGRRDEVRHLLSVSQGFRLIVAAPALTVLVLALVDVGPILLAVAVVFGIWVPAGLSGATASLQIENKTSAEAKITMLASLATQAVVLVALYAVGTADAVWAARIVLEGILVAFALVPMARVYRAAVLRPRLPRGFPPGFWRFGVPAGLAGLVAMLVLSRTEVFFLTWLSTAGAVGIFALAFGLAQHLFAPAQAIMGPLIPAVSGLREIDEASVGRAFTRTLRAGSTIVAVLCATVLPPLALLVPLLYGSDFAEAAPLVVVLGLSMGFLVAAGPVSAFVLARLSARRILSANLLALAIDLVLAVSLIPVLGAWGAVVANVSGSATRLVVLLADELGHLSIPWASAGRQGAPILVGAAACGLAWLSGEFIPGHVVTAAIVSAVVGGISLVGALRLTRTGLEVDDAKAIRRVLPPRLQPVTAPALALVTARARRNGPESTGS